MMVSKRWGHEVWGSGWAPGNSRAQADWVREEEYLEEKAKGWINHCGCRVRKRERLRVWVEDVFLRLNGGSMGQKHKRRQASPIASSGISADWPQAAITNPCFAFAFKESGWCLVARYLS